MLSSSVERSRYTGNGATSVYGYNFRIVDQSDLRVTVKNTSTLVETTLVLTTDYTVDGVGKSSGNVTLVNSGQIWLNASGKLLSTYVIVIRRVRPLTQNTSIRNQGSFYAATHEDAFDNQIMIAQQLQDQADRSIKLPETLTSSDFDPSLPTNIATANPGAVIVVKPTGGGFAMADPLTGISWQRADINYTQLLTGATTNTLTAFSLPAGYILLGLAIKHSIAFAGGVISALKLDLGIASDKTKFIQQFDAFQPVADSAFDYINPNYIASWASGTNITLQATSTGANLSALTQGVASVYYLIQKVGV